MIYILEIGGEVDSLIESDRDIPVDEMELAATIAHDRREDLKEMVDNKWEEELAEVDPQELEAFRGGLAKFFISRHPDMRLRNFETIRTWG